jgi:glutamyl-tRNA reductase
MRHADLVVSATGAGGLVIHRSAVADALSARHGRPLVLLDLAVPRDVEPGAADLHGASVIDIVSIRERLAETDATTDADIAQAHEIVAGETHRYMMRRRGDELGPLIRAVRRRGDEVARAEMQRQASRLASLTPDEREAVEALARGITAKLLHDPLVELKERSEPGVDEVHARVLAELLGIDEDTDPSS